MGDWQLPPEVRFRHLRQMYDRDDEMGGLVAHDSAATDPAWSVRPIESGDRNV